jgi:hypothetical protein
MLMTNFLYSRCFFEGISEWWSKGAGSFVVSGLQAWSGKMCCEVYLAARSPCLPSLICLRLAFHQSRSCLNKGHQYSVFTILSSNSYRVPILSIQFQSQMWECSDQARLIEYALSVWHYIWRFYVHLPEHKSSLWLELHLCYIRWRHISFHSLHNWSSNLLVNLVHNSAAGVGRRQLHRTETKRKLGTKYHSRWGGEERLPSNSQHVVVGQYSEASDTPNQGSQSRDSKLDRFSSDRIES